MAGESSLSQQTASSSSKPKTAADYLSGDAFKMQLHAALPKHLETDRFVRSAISEFKLNSALQECSVASVLGFYMQAAMLGLEPSSALGQCYPVPFNNRKTGQKECQFILSYKGMASIARRSGEVLSIDAQTVYEKDDFELVYGLEQRLIHKPYIDGEPGAARGYYVVVRFKDGGYQYKFMPKAEIEKHKKRSKAAQFGKSPWDTDYDEMAKKTVFRAMFKWLPISIEDMRVVTADDAVARVRPEALASASSPDEMLEVEYIVAKDDPSDASDQS